MVWIRLKEFQIIETAAQPEGRGLTKINTKFIWLSNPTRYLWMELVGSSSLTISPKPYAPLNESFRCCVVSSTRRECHNENMDSKRKFH